MSRGNSFGYGFTPFSRKMVDGHDALWESPGPFDSRSAWLDILFYARFAPGIVEGEPLQRGEFLASVSLLLHPASTFVRRLQFFDATDYLWAQHGAGHLLARC